ncbi:MAG: hypothetical protein IK104_06355 [Clostridia bacterium]|nr:hypothetical protein [Clostridia bacterium]
MQQVLTDRASWFLGANTPAGFYSLFDGLCDPDDGWTLYIVKGGPGTGKSTLMKRIADEADRRGLWNERVFCSSDPKSLDSVIVPSLKVSVADGTAPHVLEPVFPGAVERTVDLGAYRNDGLLAKRRAEVIALTRENKSYHASCARYLAAAAAGLREAGALTLAATDLEALDAFSERFCRRALGGTSGRGEVKRRFLSAVTPEGVFTHLNTLAGYERVVRLADRTGALSARVLTKLAGEALAAGYRVTLCPNCLNPDACLDAVLIDELSFAAVASTDAFPVPETVGRTVRLGRFTDKEQLSAVRNRLSVAMKAAKSFLGEAAGASREAKRVHDRLEEIYIAAMDFEGVAKRADTLVREIFG